MRWGLREIALFVLSGLSVAALAFVSVSGPVRTTQIVLITFGSLTAAIAAPLIESRRSADSAKTPAEPPSASDAPEHTGPVDYRVLRPQDGEPRLVTGRETELALLHAQLVKQRKTDRR